jgi:threonine dehydrogenase-like Zn-dependent dehydrogenase
MGHEFTGEVVEVGEEVRNFKPGDIVVSIFTTACLKCFYCLKGLTSRCLDSMLFGSTELDGGQAQYVRIPVADNTLFPQPPELPETSVVLLADIFPTGMLAAKNAFSRMLPEELKGSVNVVIGCGPVGLCAIIASTKWVDRIYAIDSVPERLEEAKALGAIPLHLNADPKKTILEATDGRGADFVLEIVGQTPALALAYDLIRPFGVISSVGAHNGEIPFSAKDGYAKNVTLHFGRCPARGLYTESLELMRAKKHMFGGFAHHLMPLEKAPEAYELFNQRKLQKVIFQPNDPAGLN